MSYFLCGFGSDTAACDAFEKVFAGLVPDPIRTDTHRIDMRQVRLVTYGNNKVIRNLVVRDPGTGSWLAVIGTPLIRPMDERQEQAFLAEFLADPAERLRAGIDGNFAVLAYDARKRELIAASDFNATTPVYYAATPRGMFFCSHELPLARYVNAPVDPLGFSQTIYLGVTWEARSRFRNIRKLPPCELAMIDEDQECRVERYWKPLDEAPWKGTFDDQMEQWISVLRRSVGAYYECAGQKKLLADITAGEDSRLLIATCHDLGIPFTGHVTGAETDLDVIVARRAAKECGFDLVERRKTWITEDRLLEKASSIALDRDAYQDYFAACVEFAMDERTPVDDYRVVKYCGAPGGEVFRGCYYLRGKAWFPSSKAKLDARFFTKMKFLLDFQPGLMACADEDFLDDVHGMVARSLADVGDHPVGTQIDHLLRMFQTSTVGLKYKNPLYLPFATQGMTRSIYSIPPRYKRGGKLSKACTEALFPELAVLKTQNGVPTIRKTLWRAPLFLPEYLATVRKVSSGAVSRLFKWKQANKWYYRNDLNAYMFRTLLSAEPYSSWFKSSGSMMTGHLYRPEAVDSILAQARTGSCRYMPVLGRMINQELAFRWVYGDAVSAGSGAVNGVSVSATLVRDGDQASRPLAGARAGV